MKGFATYSAPKSSYFDSNSASYSRKPHISVRLYDDDLSDVPSEILAEVNSNPKSLEDFLKARGRGIYDKEFGVNRDLYDFLNRDLASLQGVYGEMSPEDWLTNAKYSNTKSTVDSLDYKPDIIQTPYGEFDRGKRTVDKLADKFRNIFLDSHDFSPLMGPLLDSYNSPFIFDPTDPLTPAALEEVHNGKNWYEVSEMPRRLYGWQFAKSPDSFTSKIRKSIEHPAYNMNHPAWLEMESKMPSFADDPEGFMAYTPSTARDLPDVSEYIGMPDTAGRDVNGIIYTREPESVKEYKVNKNGVFENVNPKDVIETQSKNPNYRYLTFDEEVGRYVPVKDVDVIKSYTRVPGQGIVHVNSISDEAPEFNEDITADVFKDPDRLKEFFKEHGIKGSGMVSRYADPMTGESVRNNDGNFKPYDYAAGVLRRARRNSDEFVDKDTILDMFKTNPEDFLSGYIAANGSGPSVLNPAVQALVNSAESMDDLKKMAKYKEPKKEPEVVERGGRELLKDENGNYDLNPITDTYVQSPDVTMDYTKEMQNMPNVERQEAIRDALNKFINFITHHKWKRIPGEVIPGKKERIKDEQGEDVYKIITKMVDDGNGKMVPKKFKRFKHLTTPDIHLPDKIVLDLDDQQIRNVSDYTGYNENEWRRREREERLFRLVRTR